MQTMSELILVGGSFKISLIKHRFDEIHVFSLSMIFYIIQKAEIRVFSS